jgi:ABC-type transport system involved in multi-copper enzyme maturation permease subunit
MIVILVSSFPNTEQLSGKDGQLGATIGLLLLYGSAVSGFAYLTSNLFSTPSGAQIAFLFFGFVSGLILSILSLLFRLIPSLNDTYTNYLRYLFALLPPFALGEGLTNLSFTDILGLAELQGGQSYSPLDWKITGMNLVFLGVESVVFLVAAILFEYLPAQNSLQSMFRGPNFPPIDQALKDEGK